MMSMVLQIVSNSQLEALSDYRGQDSKNILSRFTFTGMFPKFG